MRGELYVLLPQWPHVHPVSSSVHVEVRRMGMIVLSVFSRSSFHPSSAGHRCFGIQLEGNVCATSDKVMHYVEP